MYYDPAKEKQSEEYRSKRDAFLKSLNSKGVRKKPYATFWYPEIAWTHNDEVLQSPTHKEKFHKINMKERLEFKKDYQNEKDDKVRNYGINKEESLYDKKTASYMEKFDSKNIKRMCDEMNNYFDDISSKRRLIDKEIYKDNHSTDDEKCSKKREIYNDRKSKSRKLSVDMNDKNDFYENSRSQSRSFKLKSRSESDSIYDYNSDHSNGEETHNRVTKSDKFKELKIEDNEKIGEKIDDGLKVDEKNSNTFDDEATEESKRIQEVIKMTEKLLEGLGKEKSFRKIRKVVLGYFSHTDDRDTMKVFLSRKMLRSCSEVNLYSDSSYQPVDCPIRSNDDVFIDEERKALFNVEEFIKKHAIEDRKIRKVSNGKTSRKKHTSEKESDKSSHKNKKKCKDSYSGSDYEKKSQVMNSSKKNEKLSQKRKDERNTNTRSKTHEKKKYGSEERRNNYIPDQSFDKDEYRSSYVDKDTGKRFKNLKIEIRNSHHDRTSKETRHRRRSSDYKLGNREERYYIDKYNRPCSDFPRNEDELFEHYHYQEVIHVDHISHPFYHYKPTSHFNHKYRPNNQPYHLSEYYDHNYERYNTRYRMQKRRRNDYEDRAEHAKRAPIFTKHFAKNHHRHSYNEISNTSRRNVHERLGKKVEDA